MALELSTIGVKFKYAVESTAGTKPSAFTEITNIISLGEMNAQPDQLDCTDLSDTWRRYIAGVKDTGGDFQVGANLTVAFKTAWEALVAASATAREAGKDTWFEIEFPGGLTSFYFTGEPVDLGTPSIEVNQVLQATAHIVPNTISGWAASST